MNPEELSVWDGLDESEESEEFEVFDDAEELNEVSEEEEDFYVDESADYSEDEIVEYYDEDGNLLSEEDLEGAEIVEEIEVESSSTVWTDSIDDENTQEDHTNAPAKAMEITSDAYSTDLEMVLVDDCAFAEPLKLSRKQTHRGLSTSVGQMGILSPIHVMKTHGYTEWLENPDGPIYNGYKYIVLSGFRRLYAAMRNKIEEVPAVVFTFKDPDVGNSLLVPLALHINRTQAREPQEVWGLLELLETQHSLSPANLEFLLNLEPGDAMRLKDIMRSDFPEVIADLLDNKKNILQSYNALQKARKELDKLAEDDTQGIEGVEGSEDIISGEPQERLDDQTVRELLELVDKDVELSDDDFADLSGAGDLPEIQKVGERHPLDPALRNAVMRRDNYRCVICGLGGPAFLGALIAHHVLPVSLKGPDTMENLVILDDSCHLSLHWVADRRGVIPMTKEEYLEYSPEDKLRIKKIRRFSEVIIDARRRMGALNEKDHPGHRMPGVGVKAVEEGFNQAGRPMGTPSEESEDLESDE